MGSTLDESKRKECSVEELSRVIFCFLKNEWDCDYIGLKNLQTKLCPNSERDDDNYARKNRSFLRKFHEAIARLKQQGLLMDANYWCCNNFNKSEDGAVLLTSVGEKSDFDEGILILVDNPYEILQELKEGVRNLDPVVAQYYLESLRTCQNGSYISSVICLGAASERTINCLSEAIVQSNPECKEDIKGKRNISTLTNYLSDNAKDVFKSVEPKLRGDLTEKLKGLAYIYRLNRNKAGHPNSVPQNWGRDEQECYLSQFRRLVTTCFEAIDVLNNVSASSMSGQNS